MSNTLNADERQLSEALRRVSELEKENEKLKDQLENSHKSCIGTTNTLLEGRRLLGDRVKELEKQLETRARHDAEADAILASLAAQGSVEAAEAVKRNDELRATALKLFKVVEAMVTALQGSLPENSILVDWGRIIEGGRS